MKNTTFASLAILLMSATAACASSSHTQKEQAPPATAAPSHRGMGEGNMAGMCPMQVPGTSVTATDVEGGIALNFTTTDANEVPDLQQRVHRVAAMHNERHGQGSARMPAVTAVTEDIPGGARVVIAPKDPAQLDEVRARVRSHAAQMAEGQCPGMHPPSEQGAGPGEQEGDE